MSGSSIYRPVTPCVVMSVSPEDIGPPWIRFHVGPGVFVIEDHDTDDESDSRYRDSLKGTRFLNIDGMLHVAGGEVCGCSLTSGIIGKACHKCGSLVHQQPIYGGIADACEWCDEWDLGPLPAHDEVGVIQ